MTSTQTGNVERPTLCLPRALLASTVYLLGRLGYGIKLEAMEQFEKEGLSPYHHSVLALLDEGIPKNQATIADALGIDRSQLVGLLDGLEERGLLERRRDPSDRRRHLVSLTPAGKKELGRLRTIVDRLEEEFLAPLDADSRAQLHALLLRVARHRDARFAPDEA